ncbi:YbaB/EbfC family nucleoid-associated protein [Nocardia sp. NPDC058058]|uniref:YbaB/EbfC family nucleoid-associated protein n=1 Tax=Nocardia sp. NPDC058058 TaxID=3346317 RepID=UPI0036DEEE78
MSNEMARARLADLVESVKTGMESIARAQQEQAKLTATGTAANRRVTATVNAHGVLVDLKFADSIDELSPAELAREVVVATQAAAVEVQRRTAEVLAGLQQDNARIPRLSEFIPGIPDVHDMLPTPPPVSMAPPGARADEDDELPPAMIFTDVETEDPDAPPTLADRGHW